MFILPRSKPELRQFFHFIKQRLIGLSVFVALASSCQKDDPQPRPYDPAREIWPLRVDNQWVMDEYSMDTSEVLKLVGEAQHNVTGTVLQNNILWYEMDALGLAHNRMSGLYVESGDPGGGLAFKYPAAPGEKYMFDSVVQITVKAAGLEKTVPAGTFSCFLYQITDNVGEEKFNYYLSPGVGLVMMEIAAQSPEGEVIFYRAELKSYTINK